MAEEVEKMIHPTVYKGDALIPPICEGLKYKCIFCNKVGDYGQTVAHQQTHRRTAVKHGDYTMYRCYGVCIKTPHFHCCYCGGYGTQTNILKHVQTCTGAASTAIPSASTVAPASAEILDTVRHQGKKGLQETLYNTDTLLQATRPRLSRHRPVSKWQATRPRLISPRPVSKCATAPCSLLGVQRQSVGKVADEMLATPGGSRHCGLPPGLAPPSSDQKCGILLWVASSLPLNSKHLGIDLPPLPVCKEEVSPEQQERSSSLVQEEPPPPQIKEEQQELLETPEEADGSALTLPVRKVWSSAQSEFLHLTVCKEEVSPERSSSLVQDEPQPPQIEEKLEELLQTPEEADGSTLTFLAVRSDDDRETDQPVARNSTEHVKKHVGVEDCGTSQPTSDDQLLPSHCSESDTEDSDEWEETREDQSVLNKLRSHKKQQRLCLSNKRSQDLKSSKQTCSMSHPEKFTCTECGEKFRLKSDLKGHTLIHTRENTFTCKVCSKSFNRKARLKSHTITHGVTRFTCTVCGKGFHKMCDLQIHIGEKTYMCTVCGKGFDHMHCVKRHMMTHTGEKPYLCTVCGKGFGGLSSVKNHMRTHTGEKPCMCTVCGKSFVSMGNVKKHMRIHAGEKTYTCTVCGKGFGDMSDVKRHMRTHEGGKKPYMCTACGKGFKCMSYAKQHMRIHTGEKPYMCTICGKNFSETGSLKKHMRIHTGEKPYMCTVCGKSFTQTGAVKQHMRTHDWGKKR